ncbi:L,D-transpeptidase family protein [Melittangium boletus]|uniref:L,D-transpeptidase family protein n=1 Tax=Melittangium boletus TaxID=83453 RepID=UPI003DA45B0C
MPPPPRQSAQRPPDAAVPRLALGVRGERVRALQRRLVALGFAAGPDDGVFGMKTLTAVKGFQRARGLTIDGLVGPSTWTALELDAVRPLLDPSGLFQFRWPASEQRAKRRARLLFNGSQLCWIWLDSTSAPICWDGVSGRDGHQTKESQTEKSKGPLPEGEWTVAQDDYQRMPERGVFEQFINELGRGGWPGGESSWGKHRIWLKPKSGTQTHGRSGFSIHGGDTPGSAGCIDLTRHLEGFIHMFREYGQDMDLTVKYD